MKPHRAISIVIASFVFCSLFVSVTTCSDVLSTPGVDYTFVSDERIESDDYYYNLRFAGIFNDECVVLGSKLYYMNDSDPSSIISVIDISVGCGWIVENYNTIRGYIDVEHGTRFATFSYTGVNSTEFYASITNLHVIIKDPALFDVVINLNIGNVYTFNGILVNIDGAAFTSPVSFSWTTGTEFGDSQCEIVVLGENSVELTRTNDNTIVTLVTSILLIASIIFTGICFTLFVRAKNNY